MKTLKKWWGMLGPGVTTGAADDDPAGIATYSQAGAQFGFKLLWLTPYSLILMGVVQEMCARIALVTGRGLAENIRIHFSKNWLYVCGSFVIIANTLNIGADLGAMADTILTFYPDMPFWIPLIVIALGTVWLEIFVSYAQYAKYLKWLAMTLLAYIFTGLLLHFDLTEILYSTFVPSLSINKEQMIMIAAVLGTTISPYLFFWQTSQEVEDEISKGENTIELRMTDGPKGIKQMKADVWSGMIFSNIVMFFIISVCASTLFKNGITDITSAKEAAEALRPLAGNFAYILFTFGILSTGLLAIPVLAASSAYIFTEAFGYKEGLYRKAKDAKAFYGIIALSVLVGLLLNFFGFNPIKALIYSSVFNAAVAPLALVFIVLLVSNKSIMGQYVSGWIGKTAGWFTIIVMATVAITTLAFVL